MNAIQAQFTKWLEPAGISLSERQLQQFETYYQTLVDWNMRMNLTGITERAEVYEKHFYDSLSLAFFTSISDVQRLADIGSGAGFPSIPLKIVFPSFQLTIVDSLNKRISFLQHVVEQLELQQVTCVHGRAEDIARTKEHRDHYDLVTARAVAKLSVLNELCLPFARPDGLFVAMKGANWSDELSESDKSLKELRGTVIGQHQLFLPAEQSERNMILIRKKGSTPHKYPRKAGTPNKEPLI